MNAELINNKVIINDEALANSLHSKGSIGILEKTKLELSQVEAYYLLNKNKIKIIYNKKELTSEQFLKKASKSDKRFYIKYKVFEDLRSKGYIIKTALKYGCDYRVYDKSAKIGKDHAKWLVSIYNENENLNWKDYSKIMRISHGVKKSTLIAIVDDEGSVTYWESNWKKI